MFNDLFSGLLIAIVGVSFAMLFFALGKTNVIADCEKIGTFYSGEHVYTCIRKLP